VVCGFCGHAITPALLTRTSSGPVPGGDQRRDRWPGWRGSTGATKDVGVGATGHDRRRDTLSCVGVADREGHLRADGGEAHVLSPGRYPIAPTGHDDPAAAQIDPADDLGSGLFSHLKGVVMGVVSVMVDSRVSGDPYPRVDPVSSESEETSGTASSLTGATSV